MNGDGRGVGGFAHDVHVTGNAPARELIQCVVRVTRPPQARAVLIAARCHGLTIADVVEGVFKLLSGHGSSIAPILLAGDDLAKVVVGVNPAGIVGIGNGGALVDRVLLVIEADRRVRQGRGHNLRSPVQRVVCIRGGQPRGAALFERDGFHQWRVGNVNASILTVCRIKDPAKIISPVKISD